MTSLSVDFQSLFEASPDVLLVLLPDAPRFTMVAATASRLAVTHTTREETIGRGVFEIFPDNPDEPDATGTSNLRASLDRVIATRAPDTMAVQKYDIRGADGTFQVKYWSPKNIPVLSPDGRVLYILHRVEDVTDLVVASEHGAERTRAMEREVVARSVELAAALRTLEATNAELESFSYSVSHDLRAPLRHIAGFAQLLDRHAREALDDQGRRYLRTITESAERMGRLIDDLLSFSRLGRAELTKRPVDLDALVGEVRAQVLDQETASGRTVVWHVGRLGECMADRALLRQVFLNLLSNALKYSSSRAETEITVTTEIDAEGAFVVAVRDNGVGFDPAYRDRLFGVFQRLHRPDEFPGTGIGLANVKRIVQRHGGRVWADSEPGTGATFWFSLPRA
ncbi:MAG TPA: ATP-binding protein [Vicinamibacterales bacterium]|nr:ATP-binding protein [Vicinamibacterales bacterium]